ncbi:patatin-like phospholipase family protein [Bordetella sp. N]|uniref:patatin-like phospholipase family protein n=1 Tax=Bordetella sp. N TaxID=1746199 RepID=UPI00070D2CF4|nr:patatin-like phospholipase family protein [Bordetella sp. N]ALM83524.1 hypothetical protein ASB57_11595 [Bordetella sp. N]
MTRCLVLGGGGVSGIAWQIGLLAGLARYGIDLREADCFVGTSAGAVVGARLAAGDDLERLAAAQITPPPALRETFREYSQSDADGRNRALIEKVGGDLMAARRRICAYALRSETPPWEERRSLIAARLEREIWPARALRLIAVEALTGAARVFTAADGVPLIDAVAASCAVPGTWPPVSIGGGMYIDGGVHSLTNAEVAAGAGHVLVLAPFGYGEGNPVAGHLRKEVKALTLAGSVVKVVIPDERSLDALGDNVLDPARRPASVRAGLAQAEGLVDALSEDWGRATA